MLSSNDSNSHASKKQRATDNVFIANPNKSRVILATCNLNQWANDYDGNLERIKQSIVESKALGAKYRLGPELEVCGYSMEDHFLEVDTYMHCDESLASILDSDLTDDILCDIGCPIMHNNVRYNCRVFCLNRQIVYIRPKCNLADDGNYRERRFFTSWKVLDKLVEHKVSDAIFAVTGRRSVPMGVAAISTRETMLASEMCEELWTAQSPHIHMALAGVEIFTNGSGSHHQLRKLSTRLDLLVNATTICGGAYLYANQRGCDGNRMYFDGCALICSNGQILAQASQFSLAEVEVVTATIDLEDIRSYRNATASFQEQSSSFAASVPVLHLEDFSLAIGGDWTAPISPTSAPIKAHLHTPEEECAYGPSCWLWDYLRRSNASGFLLPLSGGADSASVATIVYCMCERAVEEARAGNLQVQADMKRMTKTAGVGSAKELCNHLLHTAYMSTTNSSESTRSRADRLASAVGAYHSSFQIDIIVQAVLKVFATVCGKTPSYEASGGSREEDLALQNIQARLRMVMAYLCAQLFPWARSKSSFLLVLGSANVDESLRGYMTKYDCSSADLNPIGGISKGDLKRMLIWASGKYDIPAIREIAEAKPTAELRPLQDSNGGYSQLDEDEMGMSYAELGVFGTLRKIYRCGPVSMFVRLLQVWSHLTPFVVAEKVKRFFKFYAINRHKMTTLTPSYHAENYGPDDNRFDLRQFLYNAWWPRHFRAIDALAEKVAELRE